eukprot:4450324-Pyramimonas_sp.AAC.1
MAPTKRTQFSSGASGFPKQRSGEGNKHLENMSASSSPRRATFQAACRRLAGRSILRSAAEQGQSNP